MGRSPKKGVDYFSHDTDATDGPTIYTIENEFGNDGYAFWFKLLEFLGKRETLSLDLRDKADWMFFLAKCKVTEETALRILDMLADLNAIDGELWRHKIIWSDNFAKRVSGVYEKRGTETPEKPVFCDGNPQEEPKEEQKKAKKPKKQKETQGEASEKTKYADFVSMKDTEYATLCEKFGEPAAKKAIEILDNYKGSKGKTYKDDYRAILSWVIDKIKEQYPSLIKKPSEDNSESGNPFERYV